MLNKALRTLGAKVDYFIPERLNDGYGIKDEHVRIPVERGASLVISVDCGIKAVAFAARAREQGVDVIITDHHRPGETLPDAVAVLDPVLADSGYPDPGLAGVGVVFKLIQALLEKAGRGDGPAPLPEARRDRHGGRRGRAPGREPALRQARPGRACATSPTRACAA